MFSWGAASNFNTMLERATSTQLLEPDWLVIMNMCDSVRSGESDPKAALNAVKKKLVSKNPNVTLLALHCLESMVKNCGHPIHKEVATQAFMEDFKEVLTTHSSEPVREKVLELIQTWAHAFRKEPAYRAVQDVMTFMRVVEGVKFPQLKESDAMFAAQVPPEWEDSNCCHLCRTPFSTFNRKHHCRKCGQVFCHKCSNHMESLPKLGIEKKVRVCETCFLELHPEGSSAHSSPVLRTGPPHHQSSSGVVRSPTRASGHGRTPAVGVGGSASSGTGITSAATGGATTIEQQAAAAKEQAAAKLKEDQLREEEELQLALALSQSEVEFQNQRSGRSATTGPASTGTNSTTTAATTASSHAEDARRTEGRRADTTASSNHHHPAQSWTNSHGSTTSSTYPTEFVEANAPTRSECGSTTGSTESELTHYLDRKYWDERSTNNRQGDTDTPKHSVKPLEGISNSTVTGGDIEDEFEQALEKSLDTFVNRLRSNEVRGRPVANDSYAQSLFVQISSLHARLLQYVQETDDQRAYYESLQDKLQQIRDARAALDALREEHRDEERKRQEEAERTRQLQMAHKLEIMRQRKHEYLQYQHQLAMMKIQEQEMAYRSVGAPPPALPPGTMAMPPVPVPGQQPVYAPQPQYPPGVLTTGGTMLPPGQLAGAPQPLQAPQPQLQHFMQQPGPMSPPHTSAAQPSAGVPVSGAGPPVVGYYGPPAPPGAAPPGATAVVTTASSSVPAPGVPLPGGHQGAPPLMSGQSQPAFEPYGMGHAVAHLPAPPQTPLPQPCAPPQTPTPTPQCPQPGAAPQQLQQPLSQQQQQPQQHQQQTQPSHQQAQQQHLPQQQIPQQELNLPSVPTHHPGDDLRISGAHHHQQQQQQQQQMLPPPQPAEAQLIVFD